MTRKVYLDYNSTTPVSTEALDAMTLYFDKKFGNPSSTHSFGREAASALKKAAEQTARLINANANEIIFTDGGSEANQLALTGFMEDIKDKGKNHIITSQVEHNSTYQTCRMLSKNGFKVTYIRVDQEGLIDLEELDKALQDNSVGMVSLLLVNNETGTVQDFAKIREIINKHKVPLHYDAVQAVGKMAIDVNNLQASLLSLSAHKIYGPKGAGALYVKSGINIDSPAGTKNVPAIVGMGAACNQAQKELCDYIQHCRKIRDYLKSKITANFPFAYLNGSYKQIVCNTANISFSGFSAKNLSEELDQCGIAVSTGAACSEEKDEASRILSAMQLPASKLFGALRFSVGKQTTEEDIDYTIQILHEIFNKKEKAVGNSKILNLEE